MSDNLPPVDPNNDDQNEELGRIEPAAPVQPAEAQPEEIIVAGVDLHSDSADSGDSSTQQDIELVAVDPAETDTEEVEAAEVDAAEAEPAAHEEQEDHEEGELTSEEDTSMEDSEESVSIDTTEVESETDDQAVEDQHIEEPDAYLVEVDDNKQDLDKVDETDDNGNGDHHTEKTRKRNGDGGASGGIIAAIVVGIVLIVAAVTMVILYATGVVGGSKVEYPPTYVSEDQLDRLYQECSDGNMASCDDLYLQAPYGSEKERYGDTCGGRLDKPQGYCQELTNPDADQQDGEPAENTDESEPAPVESEPTGDEALNPDGQPETADDALPVNPGDTDPVENPEQDPGQG